MKIRMLLPASGTTHPLLMACLLLLLRGTSANPQSSDQRVVTEQNPESAKSVGTAVVQQLQYSEAVAILTHYEVEHGREKKFLNVLLEYVNRANAKKNNIMAEVYQEQENPSVLWTIERWSSKRGIR